MRLLFNAFTVLAVPVMGRISNFTPSRLGPRRIKTGTTTRVNQRYGWTKGTTKTTKTDNTTTTRKPRIGYGNSTSRSRRSISITTKTKSTTNNNNNYDKTRKTNNSKTSTTRKSNNNNNYDYTPGGYARDTGNFDYECNGKKDNPTTKRKANGDRYFYIKRLRYFCKWGHPDKYLGDDKIDGALIIPAYAEPGVCKFKKNTSKLQLENCLKKKCSTYSDEAWELLRKDKTYGSSYIIQWKEDRQACRKVCYKPYVNAPKCCCPGGYCYGTNDRWWCEGPSLNYNKNKDNTDKDCGGRAACPAYPDGRDYPADPTDPRRIKPFFFR